LYCGNSDDFAKTTPGRSLISGVYVIEEAIIALDHRAASFGVAVAGLCIAKVFATQANSGQPA
jgi:hypothetical protein